MISTYTGDNFTGWHLLFNPAKMRILVYIACLLCTLLVSGANRQFTKQLFRFKNEVRDDIGFITGEIDTLFESIENMNATLQNKITVPRQELIENEIDYLDKDKSSSGDVENKALIEEFTEKYKMLEKAFMAEKKLNRQLQSRLKAIEDGIAGIYEDVEKNVTSFMNVVNETFEQRFENIAKHRAKDDLVYDNYGDADLETTTAESNVIKSCDNVPQSGVFDIKIDPSTSQISVFCDAETDGGGWIVIMRRQDGSVDFDRPWIHYKNGFGNLDGEFWLGNDIVHNLTKFESRELRIDFQDFDGGKAYAKYAKFSIGPEVEKYRLKLDGYSGTAGDALTDMSVEEYKHNGMKFSTSDSDNDVSWRSNCAGVYPGGWWFNSCFGAHLTAIYSHTGKIRRYHGMIWEPWTGWDKAVKFVEMKIR